MADDPLLDQLADAVLEGTAIDWAAAEAGAEAATQPLVRYLKMLATLTRVHREAGHDAAVGAEWGPFRLLEQVGRGTSGEVFRAWDARLDREVALKLLPAPSRNASAIIREGQLLAKVRHPSVVTIHGAEQIGDCVGLW